MFLIFQVSPVRDGRGPRFEGLIPGGGGTMAWDWPCRGWRLTWVSGRPMMVDLYYSRRLVVKDDVSGVVPPSPFLPAANSNPPAEKAAPPAAEEPRRISSSCVPLAPIGRLPHHDDFVGVAPPETS